LEICGFCRKTGLESSTNTEKIKINFKTLEFNKEGIAKLLIKEKGGKCIPSRILDE